MRAILVTVHGTWAPGAPWAAPDSPLGKAVTRWYAEQGVEATVIPFQWSGRNSIAARRTAGASLAELLDRLSRENRGAGLYVIAHSHGGSVFSYAMLLRPELARQVNGFVALATPWVGLEACAYATALRNMLAKLALYAAFSAVLVPVPFVVAELFGSSETARTSSASKPTTESFPPKAGERGP